MNLEGSPSVFLCYDIKNIKKDIFFAHSAEIVDGMWSEKATLSSIREIFLQFKN